MNTTLINNKYRITRRIGGGSFGEIFVGVSTTGEKVAIKFERQSAKCPQLRHEYKVYREVQGAYGFASVYHYGSIESYNVMVMDLLGPSLEDLFNRCSRRFSLKTVLQLADQLLERVDTMHNRHLIHRDIKPANFVIGLGDEQNKVYCVDFGLSKRYRHPKTLQHIPHRDGRSLTGTPRYASVNNHLGIEQSRRDDLESIGYVLIYFLKGTLPWQGLKAKTASRKYKLILERKQCIPLQQLCQGCPTQFTDLLSYCRALKFDSKPDVAQLRQMFIDLYHAQGYHNSSNTIAWDWDILDHPGHAVSNADIKQMQDDEEEDDDDDDDLIGNNGNDQDDEDDIGVKPNLPIAIAGKTANPIMHAAASGQAASASKNNPFSSSRAYGPNQPQQQVSSAKQHDPSTGLFRQIYTHNSNNPTNTSTDGYKRDGSLSANPVHDSVASNSNNFAFQEKTTAMQVTSDPKHAWTAGSSNYIPQASSDKKNTTGPTNTLMGSLLRHYDNPTGASKLVRQEYQPGMTSGNTSMMPNVQSTSSFQDPSFVSNDVSANPSNLLTTSSRRPQTAQHQSNRTNALPNQQVHATTGLPVGGRIGNYQTQMSGVQGKGYDSAGRGSEPSTGQAGEDIVGGARGVIKFRKARGQTAEAMPVQGWANGNSQLQQRLTSDGFETSGGQGTPQTHLFASSSLDNPYMAGSTSASRSSNPSSKKKDDSVAKPATAANNVQVIRNPVWKQLTSSKPRTSGPVAGNMTSHQATTTPSSAVANEQPAGEKIFTYASLKSRLFSSTSNTNAAAKPRK